MLLLKRVRLLKEQKRTLQKANALAPVSIMPERYNYVKKNIELNPPLKPDFKRVVEYYSNKYQYVELNYHGQNLQHSYFDSI